MPIMRLHQAISAVRSAWLLWPVLVTVLLALGLAGPAAAEFLDAFTEKSLSTRKIVLEEVEKLVAKHGVRVGVIGSSVKGKKYLDPLLGTVKNFSDVDMTLIVDKLDGVDPGAYEEALFKKWRAFRDDLQMSVSRRLTALDQSGELAASHGGKLADDYAKRVMDSINVYPPDQLVEGAKDSDDYLKQIERMFKEYDDPKKFHHVNLGADKFDAIVAGESGFAFRKSYEATHGVVFEMYDGKVIHGFHDLQEVSKFTPKGVSQISGQFLSKSKKALALGEDAAKDLDKNLRRLNQYLRKAKSMAGVQGSAIANPEIDDLLRKLDVYVKEAGDYEKGVGKWLTSHQDDISRALMQADIDTRLCHDIANATDEASRIFKRKILSHPKWTRFKRQLGRHYRDVSDAIPMSKITGVLEKLAYAAEYVQIRQVYAEQGANVALGQFMIERVFDNSFLAVFRIAFEITMEEAKSYGYQLAVSRQGCEDLLAGIISVMGAEKFQKGYQMEEFAALFIHEDVALENFEHLAKQAVIRPGTALNHAIQQTETGKAEELLKKCEKPIMTGWRETRQQWFLEAATTANILRDVVDPLPLALEVTSQTRTDAGREVEVAISSVGDAAAIHGGLVRLRDQIGQLGGKEQIGQLHVMQYFQWTVDGKPVRPSGLPGGKEEKLTLLDARNDSLFGGGRIARFVFDDHEEHEIKLQYRLVFKPEASIAPEIMARWKALWGGFRKTAVLPLEPPLKPINIAGPSEVSEGERVTFALTGNADPASYDRAEWYIKDRNSRTAVGTGQTVELAFDAPGRTSLIAVLPGAEAGDQPLGRDEVDLVVYHLARLTVVLSDSTNDQTSISRADVVLQGSGKEGRTYRLTEADDLQAGLPIVPGPYQYRVKASGYEEVMGNTQLGFADPVLALTLDPEPQRPPETQGNGTPDSVDLNQPYLGLTLDHRELILEPGGQGYVRAEGIVSALPSLKLVDVTSVADWTSDDPGVADVSFGVITAGDSPAETFVSVRLTSPDGSRTFTETVRVIVKDLSAVPPEADFVTRPDLRTYRPDQTVTFTQTVPLPHDDLTFHWYIDGQVLDGPEIAYAFPDEGKHTVTLIVTSTRSGKQQRLARTIEVTHADTPDIGISVSPQPPLQAPVEVTLRVTGDDPPETARFVWVLDGTVLPDTGRETDPLPLDEGDHRAVVLVIDDNGEHQAERDIVVDKTGEDQADDAETARPDARWRNRFMVSATDEQGRATVSSQYWIGGDGRWSDWRTERTIQVEGQALMETGPQDSGYNTGYLLYVPKGRNELRYEVYDYDYAQHRMQPVYDGRVPLHGKEVDPATVSITNVQSRAITFEWHSKTGDFGRLRLYKTQAAGFVTGGLEELDFIEAKGGTGDSVNLGNKDWVLDDDAGGGNSSQATGNYDPNRDYENLPQSIMWSAPPGERVYIYVGLLEMELWMKMKITGASDFGFVDEKGRYKHTGGGDVGYLEHAMQLKTGLNLMPVVPRAEIEEIVGDDIRFVTQYEFMMEGHIPNHLEDSIWSRDGGDAGISTDGTRLPLELVTIDAMRRKTSSVNDIYWKPEERFYIRETPEKIELRGAGLGSWGEQWKTVVLEHRNWSAVGTGAGPAVAYEDMRGVWHVKLFDYRTGDVLRHYNRSEPMRIGHGGEYGAYIFVGINEDRFYAVDIFNDRMRRYDPVTREYID